MNLAAVFTFVAVWHDTSLQMVAWGWLIVAFILPEMVCVGVARPRLLV
jgi:protein-cysteine N-palmitoyltransferase HHAT